jgi:hypothetical protein
VAVTVLHMAEDDARLMIAALAEPVVLLVFGVIVDGAGGGRLRVPGVGNVVSHALRFGEEDVVAEGCDRGGC